MYAAAGGASLASRQARRKQRQHHTSENMHLVLHKRFQQLQHQHAPACAETYHYMRTSSSGFLSPSHLPSCTDLHGRGTAAAIDFSLQEQLLEGKSSTVWSDRDKKDGYSPCSELPPALIGHGKLKLSEAQRKWAKKIKVHEPSYGDGSSIEELRGGLHPQYDAAANMVLYIGLCAVALGLVIAFVGTGEKGFKTVQLRLIGPVMIGCGVVCCILRVLFCFCPTRCMRQRFARRHKKNKAAHLSDAAQLNRHAFAAVAAADEKFRLEFYQHLPFHGRMTENLMLFDQGNNNLATKDGKKKVSIAATATAPRNHDKRAKGPAAAAAASSYVFDDAASDNLSTLREMSPLHEEDLIDFRQSSNSFENIPSLDSSLEYLNGRLKEEEEDPVLPAGTKDAYASAAATEEQLQRLKSTLQFRDSTDQFADSRLTMSYDDFDLHDELKGGAAAAAADEEADDTGGSCGDRRDHREEPSKSADTNVELVLSAGTLERKN